MNLLELEIARTLGASSFLIYTYVKSNPGSSPTDIGTELGLSYSCIYESLKKLRDTNVLVYDKVGAYYRTKTYKMNKEESQWKFH